MEGFDNKWGLRNIDLAWAKASLRILSSGWGGSDFNDGINGPKGEKGGTTPGVSAFDPLETGSKGGKKGG